MGRCELRLTLNPWSSLSLSELCCVSTPYVNAKRAGGHSKSRERSKAQGILGKYNHATTHAELLAATFFSGTFGKTTDQS